MHHILNSVLTPEEAQVQTAWITGVLALVGILITAIAARLFSHPKTPSKDPDEKRNKSQSILSTYSGDQNEFIHLVMNDSKDVHERLDKLDTVIEALKKERTQILGAFGRYISKLAAAWGSGGKMPYPDEADMAILEETLPADWRRRPR